MLVHSLVLLSAFSYSVFAGKAGPLKGAPGVSPRQLQECNSPGWIPVCPGDLPCIPPTGTCCTGDYYHLPGETCPDGYSEVPRIDQSDPPSASITPAPSASSIPDPVVVDYSWYTYSLTYYYTYYYYYYFEATYEITSTETTYYTTFSLTASDVGAANSAAESISASISVALETQSETPTVEATPLPSSTLAPVSTSRVASSSSRATTSSDDATSSEAATSTTVIASPSTSTPAEFSGAAAGLRVGSASGFGEMFLFTIGALGLAPGMLMLLL
ncbi:hypothetical protein BKA58DRAFT_216277 [Alternaria rosae]|uniref:uncharacterized protein n=1 Tax=Alternaria rosae TaxID=1187941 RepID=UPI001E8D1A61|nr:uncharacterized protein BKA58DRAFT_216277 [Alternaria rosae]KAH6867024.1 hypothetical protein BKA58DRAFT_216277 [Alternaria rosae]